MDNVRIPLAALSIEELSELRDFLAKAERSRAGTPGKEAEGAGFHRQRHYVVAELGRRSPA